MLGEISDNEYHLIEAIRSLAAYERLEIIADSTGKVDEFLVIRSRKIILKQGREPLSVK